MRILLFLLKNGLSLVFVNVKTTTYKQIIPTLNNKIIFIGIWKKQNYTDYKKENTLPML